jgi:hypothetical protein
LENQGEESIILVHNSNNDHSLYSNNETLSKQFNRILYKKFDDENGFDKNEKAKTPIKDSSRIMLLTQRKMEALIPSDFVKAAKKANVYIQRNVNNNLLTDRLRLKVEVAR